jgi:hypothetical protein
MDGWPGGDKVRRPFYTFPLRRPLLNSTTGCWTGAHKVPVLRVPLYWCTKDGRRPADKVRAVTKFPAAHQRSTERVSATAARGRLPVPLCALDVGRAGGRRAERVRTTAD